MSIIVKRVAKRLLVLLLFTTPILNASRGFGGGFAGGMVGSMLGSAMTQPRSRTVIVRDTGNVTRAEAQRLEQLIIELESRTRSDLNTLLDRIRKDENIIRSLEDTISQLKGEVSRLQDKTSGFTE